MQRASRRNMWNHQLHSSLPSSFFLPAPLTTASAGAGAGGDGCIGDEAIGGLVISGVSTLVMRHIAVSSSSSNKDWVEDAV